MKSFIVVLLFLFAEDFAQESYFCYSSLGNKKIDDINKDVLTVIDPNVTFSDYVSWQLLVVNEGEIKYMG